MESSLNEAHHQERKAEAFLNSRRFQEAINCYQRTIELLDEAMKLTKVERALESIRLQRIQHVRRQTIVKHKEKLFEARRAFLLLQQRALKQQQQLQQQQQQQHKMSTGGGGNAYVRAKKAAKSKCTEQLQQAIYRNIDDNDSLLQFLRRTESRSAAAAATATASSLGVETSIGSTDPLDFDSSRRMAANKTPKDDKTIIEELRINNVELRRLVDVLVGDLEDSRTEVARLERLVEDMRLRIREKRSGDDDEAGEAAADEVMPTLSPFVFSSSSSTEEFVETTPPNNGVVDVVHSGAAGVVTAVGTDGELPALAPLEMPPLIDFSEPDLHRQQQQQHIVPENKRRTYSFDTIDSFSPTP